MRSLKAFAEQKGAIDKKFNKYGAKFAPSVFVGIYRNECRDVPPESSFETASYG